MACSEFAVVMNMTSREVVVEIEVVIVEGRCSARGRAPRAAPPTGRRGSRSTSCRPRRAGRPGCWTPAFFRLWMILPGSAPMYVRRWPRISASSRTPPSDRRTKLPAGRARDRLGERGLADAGRPDQAQDRPLQLLHQRLHRQVLEDALLDLLQAVVILVEDPLGLGRCRACPRSCPPTAARAPSRCSCGRPSPRRSSATSS